MLIITNPCILLKKNDFNEIGLPFNVVPNIVHYVLFTIHEINFEHFISLLSVLKNQKPEKIYIHCDCSQLRGDYYRRALRVANKTNTQIIIRNIERPTKIFGQNLSEKWLNWHSADITRIRILQEFGGIYLDKDVYVIQSLNSFFKYEMSVNWEQGQNMEIQTLIANKNARFLGLWLNSYHDYHPDRWVYNSGELPAKSILSSDPSLIHRVRGGFGAYGWRICSILYEKYYPNWSKDFYTIHLSMGGNEVKWKDCLQNPNKIVTLFDEQIVYKLNVTFGEISRIIFDFEKTTLLTSN